MSGVLAGVAAAMATIMLVQTLNALLFPMPAIDWYDPEAVRRLMEVVPVAASDKADQWVLMAVRERGIAHLRPEMLSWGCARITQHKCLLALAWNRRTEVVPPR